MGSFGDMKRKRLNLDQQQEVAARRRKGETVAELSAAYGVSIRSIYRTLKEERGDTVADRKPTRIVSFRVPEDEIDAFLEAAKGVGIHGSSQGFRALLRMSQGLFELFPSQIEDFRSSVWLLDKQGQLLNQLAKAVHKGKLRLIEEDRKLLSECIESNLGVVETLTELLSDAASRRGYSTRYLKDVADSAERGGGGRTS